MTTPPSGSGGPPPGTPEQPRRAERIALIVAGIGAVAAIIAAIIQAIPDFLPDDPPVGTTPTASSSAPTGTPEPDGPTTTPQPSTDLPAAPEASVACTPDLGEDVTVLDVRSSDGGTGIGDSIIVTVQVNLPATSGGAYWLMVHLPNEPRPIEIARQPLGLQAIQEIPVALASGPGSVRTFYVAYGDRRGVRWFEENEAHNGDSSWDGNRVTLPDGVRQVSNSCQVVRTE